MDTESLRRNLWIACSSHLRTFQFARLGSADYNNVFQSRPSPDVINIEQTIFGSDPTLFVDSC